MRGNKRTGNLSAQRRRRKRVGLGIGALVVVAALGVGIGIAVQRGEDAPAIAAPPTPVPVPELIAALDDSAPMPSAAGLAAAIDRVGAGGALGDFTAAVSDARTGERLFGVRDQQPMIGASTTKVLTAAAALLTLDPQARRTVKAERGGEPGQVFLVGDGDPTLTDSPEPGGGFYPGGASLAALADALRSVTPPITSVVVDPGAYGGPALAQGWRSEDIAGGYLAPIEPMMLDGARLDPNNEDSPRSSTPALDVGRALARRLELDPDSVTVGTAPEHAVTLAQTSSAPLRDRLRVMLTRSDNVLAETIGREVAAATGHPATFDGATEAITETLTAAGFDLTGVVLHDASGLSTDGRVTAGALDAVLTAAAGTGDVRLRPLLDDLPVAGVTGSLSNRYTDANRFAAGWLRAKTGTLTSVNALAGYVVDVDGRPLTFALLSNGTGQDGGRAALDSAASALRACGCR